MISSARRQAWAKGCRFCVATRLQGLCRAGVFARRLGFAASLGLRDDASIVPYGRGAGPCRGLQDTCGSRRQCTLPSAPCGASTSPCRGGFANGFHPKGSPARGAVGAGPPLGVCGSAGFPGRCKHRPLRRRGRALPGFAGYPWGKAAMHPSVCALRRIHRPVCGAHIALRALKHACALRPLHLLRLAFSAAGGARLRSPLQGRLLAGGFPGGSVVAGGWRDDARIVPYGRGVRPCRSLQDTRGAGRQCTPPSAPCGASTSPCRGGFANGFHPKGSPARGAVGALGSTAALGFRDDASIVPYGRGVRP